MLSTVRDEVHKDAFRMAGLMMELSSEIVSLVEAEKYGKASTKIDDFGPKLMMLCAGLQKAEELGDDVLESDYEDMVEQSREALQEGIKRMFDQFFNQGD